MATKQKTTNYMGQPMTMICTAVMIIVLLLVFGLAWQKRHMVATCAPETIKLSAGQQSGAAGTIYQHMMLTNTGKKACTISGYPTAFLYGSDGYALGSAAAARPQPAPLKVTLDPGETANTVLGYPQAGNFDPGICSAKSTALKLFIPGAVSPLELPLEVAWCPGFSSTAVAAGN